MINRVSQLRKSFDQNKIDALLVSSAVNVQYLTGYPNFSKDEREAYLFITKNSAILFTDARYIEAVEQTVPAEITPVINRPLEIINQMVKNQKLSRVGVEKNLTVAEFERIKKKTKTILIITEDLIESLRSVKDPSEIIAIKKAAELTDRALRSVLTKIKEGVTEKEIAWELEKFIREGGGVLAFDSIVAFGPHSSIPHHMSSDYRLRSTDEFVLLDFGAKVDGYCSDMTRTLLTKSSSEKTKKMYRTVLSAQQAAAQSIRNELARGTRGTRDTRGTSNASQAATIANDILQKAGFDPVPHGLGHGIGLEVHENPHLHPKSDDTLVAGNYFSIEPGIYIPGFGGVRIEDDYLITEKGLEQVTKSPNVFKNPSTI